MNSEILNLIQSLSGECECGVFHETQVRDIQIGSGLVCSVGKILKENHFPKKILLVADQNTLKAAEGIIESLNDFEIEFHLYEDLRVAKMEHVEELEKIIQNRNIAILSVGTGSINDPCRLAAARQNKMLCIFATAPSMDGFSSYCAPIVSNGFKITYPAKSPEVIIGDTKILSAAPTALKSAGFGDMVAKYVGLVDWKISHLLTGEIYCEKVARLTRDAVDELISMADKVVENDEETAGKIFEALLKTGIGMSFMQNSRPASGAEHIVSHLIECMELQEDLLPNLHGEDIGVCTLELLRYYQYLSERKDLSFADEKVDWEEVYSFYGPLKDEIVKMNHPDNIIDLVDPRKLQKLWPKIIEIIQSVPTYDECISAMKKAGCKTTIEEIGKDRNFFYDCLFYSPFMRRRLTLLRLCGMIDPEMNFFER